MADEEAREPLTPALQRSAREFAWYRAWRASTERSEAETGDQDDS